MAQDRTNTRRSTKLDREIDDNLKRAFDQMASEPVPDRFTDLLKQLKDASGGRDAANDTPNEVGTDD